MAEAAAMIHQEELLFETPRQLPDSVRDERSIMSYPFFALTKQPAHDTLVFEHRDIRLTVEPGKKGRATIYDQDLLLYAATILNHAVDRGATGQVSRRLGFSGYSFLKFSGRGVGGNRYAALRDMLYRLKTTMFTTNIETGGKRRETGFSMIDNYTIDEESGRIEIWLNEWFYDAIVKDRAVIPVSTDYFRITNPTARKIYEVAKRHIGQELTWAVGLINLQRRVGSQMPPHKFKKKIERIIEEDMVPEFSVSLRLAGPNEDGYGKGAHKVVFMRKREPGRAPAFRGAR